MSWLILFSFQFFLTQTISWKFAFSFLLYSPYYIFNSLYTTINFHVKPQRVIDQQSLKLQKIIIIRASHHHQVGITHTAQQLHNQDYRFFEKDKGKPYVLSNDNYTTNKGVGYSLLALADAIMPKKHSSIRFRLNNQLKAGQTYQMGLCIKNLAQAVLYSWNTAYDLRLLKNNNIQGTFLLEWRSLNTSIPSEQCLRYQKGHVIRIQTNVNELIFVNENTKIEVRMPIEMTEQEQKQARFCISTGGGLQGGSVTILKPDQWTYSCKFQLIGKNFQQERYVHFFSLSII